MSVDFTIAGPSTISVTPIPGTFQYGDGNDDRGGGVLPVSRAGVARNGSIEAIITTTFTVAIALSLISPVGPGAITVEGSHLQATEYSNGALVDVSIEGDAVQKATITWKGSIA